MQIAVIDNVEISSDFSTFPFTIKQSSALLPACAQVLVSTLSISSLLIPVTLIAIHGLTDPQGAQGIVDRPFSSVLLAIGLLVAVGLLAIPLRSGLNRLRQRGAIRVGLDHVTVEQQGLIGRKSWEASFDQFAGVTHHIRASLSGARHEIILVHPDPRKNVLLNLSHRAPERGADQFAQLFGVKVIPASVLYSRRGGKNSRRAGQTVDTLPKAA